MCEKRDLDTALPGPPWLPPPHSHPLVVCNQFPHHQHVQTGPLSPNHAQTPQVAGTADGATVLPSVQTRGFESCLLFPPPHFPAPENPALPSLPSLLLISTILAPGQATSLPVLDICSGSSLPPPPFSLPPPSPSLLSSLSHPEDPEELGAAWALPPALNSFDGPHCPQDPAPGRSPAFPSDPLLSLGAQPL